MGTYISASTTPRYTLGSFVLFFIDAAPLSQSPGRHCQHHGAAQLVRPPRPGEHLRRGLGLFYVQQGKPIFQQGLQQGGKGPVILHHVFPQKAGVPLPFHKIPVHREMPDVPLPVILPVLGPLGSRI